MQSDTVTLASSVTTSDTSSTSSGNAQQRVASATRNLSLIITLFTGFTALVYEVTWHYYLGNLLGSQARSTAVILACFLGGLALGYQLFGRLSRNFSPRGLIQLCGIIEMGIGFWAFLFPVLYECGWSIQLSFGEAQNLIVDVILAFALIGPPTMMMGGSLPLLTQGLSKNLEDATGFHSRLYIINTLGAFLGTLWAGFILIPLLGLSATLFRMGIINVFVGAILFCLGASVSADKSVHSEEDSVALPAQLDSRATIRLAFLCLFACTAGFVSISLQTVLTRVLGLSVGSSPYTFSLVVSSFILVLALGAAVLSDRPKKPISVVLNQLLIGLGILIIYYAVPNLPYYGHVLRSLLTNAAPAFWIYHVGIFVGLSLLVAIPVGALGANLPLLFRESRDRAELLGDRVGLIYGVNAIGCLLGAIFGGYYVLHWINLDDLLVISGSLAFFTLWIMAIRLDGPSQVKWGVAALIGLLLLGMTERWDRLVMGKGSFNMPSATSASYDGPDAFYRFINSQGVMAAYKDDPNTTVGVLEYKGASLSIMINGKSDGSTQGNDRVTTTLLAHLPALLQTSASSKAAVIGFGTGITVGSLARYDYIKEIDLCEISEGVRAFSPLFDPYNSQASKSPKLQWRMGDAYRFLVQSQGNYSMIISEPSNPWVAGVERLYTSEFYDVTRKKLAAGGVFAQWFHTYNISDETLALVLRTFKHSFKDAHIFGNSGDVILLGANEPLGAANVEKLRKGFEVEWIRTELSQVGFRDADRLLAYENLAPWGVFRNEELHTLDHPRLSHRAGRDKYQGLTVSVAGFNGQPQYKLWTLRSYFDTLLGRITPQPLGNEQYKEMAKKSCGTPNIGFFNTWREQSILCRGSLVALAINGEIASSGAIHETILKSLKELNVRSGVAMTTPPPQVVQNTLEWLIEYPAPFTNVDPGMLRSFATRCFGVRNQFGGRCRIALAQVLLNNNFIKEAKEELASVERDRAVPEADPVLQMVKTIVEHAS